MAPTTEIRCQSIKSSIKIEGTNLGIDGVAHVEVLVRLHRLHVEADDGHRTHRRDELRPVLIELTLRCANVDGAYNFDRKMNKIRRNLPNCVKGLCICEPNDDVLVE